jgi:hypothetical protein
MGIEKFGNRQLIPSNDGVSNTITTVLKDNLLLESVAYTSRKRSSVHKLELGGVIANAITAINADSMIAEPIKQVESEIKD